MSDSIKMVLRNRTHVLRTTYGHIVRFEKDKPVNVPRICYRDAIAIGAERVDGISVEDAFEEAPKQVSVTDPADRAEEYQQAFNVLVELNDSEDFSASGQPKVAAVRRVSKLGDASAKEIAAEWQRRYERLAQEKEAAKIDKQPVEEESEE